MVDCGAILGLGVALLKVFLIKGLKVNCHKVSGIRSVGSTQSSREPEDAKCLTFLQRSESLRLQRKDCQVCDFSIIINIYIIHKILQRLTSVWLYGKKVASVWLYCKDYRPVSDFAAVTADKCQFSLFCCKHYRQVCAFAATTANKMSGFVAKSVVSDWLLQRWTFEFCSLWSQK